MIKLKVGKVSTTVTDVPDELVFCPGCGKELGRRPTLLFEDIKHRQTGRGIASESVRVLDNDGHTIELGPGRYVYLCAKCAKRWIEPNHKLDA